LDVNSYSPQPEAQKPADIAICRSTHCPGLRSLKYKAASHLTSIGISEWSNLKHCVVAVDGSRTLLAQFKPITTFIHKLDSRRLITCDRACLCKYFIDDSAEPIARRTNQLDSM